SVDPMAKERPSLSPYNYVQWNPLNKIDPTGLLDDDYFTKNGKYLGSDGDDNSHNIRIVDNETYNNLLNKNDSEGKPLLQTSGDAKLFNDSEMSAEARLAVYEHYNETGLNTEINTDEVNEGVLMSYSTSVKIKIPVEQNTGEKVVNNYYNIKSSFDYERGHYNDHCKFGDSYRLLPTSTQEVRAIWHQKSQPNFRNTTPKYRKGINKF
ncbi:MAG: hypothetical protein U9Q98_12300, partial [Bacteroidota bacterium]|nr:hypothetical protein [Bacteroidota bacterium]